MKRNHIGAICRTVAVLAVLCWAVPSAEAGFWSKIGKFIGRFGDDIAKHADDVAKHADDVAKHGDDAAKAVTKNADDAAKAAAGSADDAAKAAARGADDVAEGGLRAAGKAAEKGGKTLSPGVVLAAGAAAGIGAAGVGEGVGRALEGAGKGDAQRTAADKDPGTYAKSSSDPMHVLAERVGEGMSFLLKTMSVLVVAMAVKIVWSLIPRRKRDKPAKPDAAKEEDAPSSEDDGGAP
ncbi:MAG: hypothetical protein IK066_02525 [Kiritimatiellae bacterium]|nr:hypothetical protein [Kiritimatiellia bacterium]